MRRAALAVLALLAACDGGGERQGVGGVTADEAAQLNNAAEMLDAAPNPTAPEDLPLGANDSAGS